MAPPVVLIHGFATSTERTCANLGGLTCSQMPGGVPIGIDLLGHGDAPKPTDPEAYDDLVTPVLERFPDSPARCDRLLARSPHGARYRHVVSRTREPGWSSPRLDATS